MAKWIMVVDDDTANLKAAGSILSKNNMRVTALKSGRALLNYITENGAPDLVLLDIMMPEMDGFETLEKLRELEKNLEIHEIPVIFLTSVKDKEHIQAVLSLNPAGYLLKPPNRHLLVTEIKKTLGLL